MIDVIEIIVSINGAKATMSEQIYSNNANQYRALVRFEDESWENYNKMIVFDRVKNYDTPIAIMVNNDNKEFIEIVDNRSFYCVIPWEVLTQPGYFNISIHGSLDGSQKSISVKDKITIYDGGNATIYPRVPTPNMYEQLMNILDPDGIKEDLKNIKKELQQIEDNVENQPINYVFNNLEDLERSLLDKNFLDKLVIGDNFFIRDKDVPDYWWDGKEKIPLESEKIELPELVGQITENGGEIFNDYENNKALSEYSSASGGGNIAGGKGFNILEIISESSEEPSENNNKFIKISDATGIEVNDVFSLYSKKLDENFDFVGKVLKIDGNLIAVDNYNNSDLLTMLDTLKDTVDGSSSEYIWFPNKPNLNGDIPLGIGASASGCLTRAIMIGSHTEGYNTIAAGKYSHAEGKSTTAGYASHAEGRNTKAIGVDSHAEGGGTEASGIGSHAEGSHTKASQNQSHAEGYKTEASGYHSHSEGSETLASGNFSHAEGQMTKAWGSSSHVEGKSTAASGEASHAEGNGTIASGVDSHAEGGSTTASGEASHAEGSETKASGRYSHAEGRTTIASGHAAHAENSAKEAKGTNSHAEGSLTETHGNSSHAEGHSTIASGDSSHAEGSSTKASQNQSHAEGYKTEASGYHSHSEGSETLASGNFSHSGGKGTIAAGEAQTAIGRYNSENFNALFIVGNGINAENRSNAFVVNADGSATIKTSGTNDLNVVNYKQLKDYVAENGSASSWDSQNEMLFSTGMVRIKNVVDTDGDDDGGTIHIGNATTATEGDSVTISQTSICFDGLIYSNMSSTLNRYGLQLVKGDENIGITGDGITYNNQLLSWKRIIAAVEAIENAVDVSEVGQ